MRGTEHGAGMAQQQEQLAAIDVKKTFWEDLKSDLEVVAQEWTLLLEKQAATALTAVITVARATMTQYQFLLAMRGELIAEKAGPGSLRPKLLNAYWHHA